MKVIGWKVQNGNLHNGTVGSAAEVRGRKVTGRTFPQWKVILYIE
jgi:hypothetical protein